MAKPRSLAPRRVSAGARGHFFVPIVTLYWNLYFGAIEKTAFLKLQSPLLESPLLDLLVSCELLRRRAGVVHPPPPLPSLARKLLMSPAKPRSWQPAPHYSRHLPLSSQVLARLDEAAAAAAAAAPSTAARRRPRTRASDSPTAAMTATTSMTQTTSAISPKSPMSSSLARRGIMDCRARPRPRTRFRLVLSEGVGHEKVSARQLPWHVALAWAT